MQTRRTKRRLNCRVVVDGEDENDDLDEHKTSDH